MLPVKLWAQDGYSLTLTRTDLQQPSDVTYKDQCIAEHIGSMWPVVRYCGWTIVFNLLDGTAMTWVLQQTRSLNSIVQYSTTE